jgi:spermidine/putrescine-binding protein
MLIWWDYLDPRVLAKIKNEGYDLDLNIYKSNETALSRLANGKSQFDVAVVSNIVMSALQSGGLFSPAARLNPEGQVESFLPKGAAACVPYLWSSTVFSYDSRKTNKVPKSLKDLLALKAEGFKIAVVDDPFEVAARLIKDAEVNCKSSSDRSSVFSALKDCSDGKKLLKAGGLAAADFRSSVEDVYIEGNAAASYGWHGAVAGLLANSPWLKLEPAARNPIIGTDNVCILKKPHESKASLERKIRFVKLLTDPESTHWNVETTQYFSPYKNDTIGLKPPVKELRDRIVQAIGKSEAVVITPPSPEVHGMINSWWQELRYGRK